MIVFLYNNSKHTVNHRHTIDLTENKNSRAQHFESKIHTNNNTIAKNIMVKEINWMFIWCTRLLECLISNYIFILIVQHICFCVQMIRIKGIYVCNWLQLLKMLMWLVIPVWHWNVLMRKKTHSPLR